MDNVVQNESTVKKAHSGIKWLKVLLYWFLGLLVIGSVGCAILYRYLGVYESVRPERIMDEMMETTSAEDWQEIALQGLTDNIGAYDNVDTLRENYRNAFLSGTDYTYMKDSLSSTDALRCYRIRLGNVDICTVELEAEEEPASFGLVRWTTTAVTPADGTKNLSSMMVEIVAPAGEEMLINGKPVEEDCIAEDFVAYADLTTVEAQMDEVPHAIRYQVGPMYGDVLVTDSSGNELAPTSSTNDSATYELLIEPKAVSVTAPFDVTVYYNDVALTEEDISSQEESLLTDLQDYTGGVDWYNVTYDLGPLYAEPEFRAEGPDGTLLTAETDENGNIRFLLPEDEALREEQLETVQSFFDAFISYSSQHYDAYRHLVVLGKILPNSELYSYVNRSVTAMKWAPGSSVITYNYLNFTNFHAVSDGCFMCTISYNANYSAEFFYEQHEELLENTYEMVFAEKNGRWYAAAMRLDNE